MHRFSGVGKRAAERLDQGQSDWFGSGCTGLRQGGRAGAEQGQHDAQGGATVQEM